MEFKSDAQKTVFNRTREYLHSLFGEVNVKVLDHTFVMQEGSTFVYVRAIPIGDKKAGVEVFSHVVVGIDVTEELMRYLLTANLKLVLGAFGLAIGKEGKATILLTHTVLGETMQREELYASVTAVARVADEMDDELVTKFGGETALGRLVAVQDGAEIWE
jgi:hypothetical protein